MLADATNNAIMNDDGYVGPRHAITCRIDEGGVREGEIARRDGLHGYGQRSDVLDRIGRRTIDELFERRLVSRANYFHSVLFGIRADDRRYFAVIIQPYCLIAPGDAVDGITCQVLGLRSDNRISTSLTDSHLAGRQQWDPARSAIDTPIRQKK